MQRAQIFCIGASSIYGVGGTKGSWADLLKLEIHNLQYNKGGIGQVHEVYNLAVPGARIKDCNAKTEVELKVMSKPGRKIISIIQIMGNNALAIGSPDNFESSPEEYRQEMRQFLIMAKKFSDHVICLGATPVDESKTMPIIKDSEKNSKVYMSNERRMLFEPIIGELAEELGLEFLPLHNESLLAGWAQNFQYEDGIHPNDAGYVWIYEQIKPKLMPLLGL